MTAIVPELNGKKSASTSLRKAIYPLVLKRWSPAAFFLLPRFSLPHPARRRASAGVFRCTWVQVEGRVSSGHAPSFAAGHAATPKDIWSEYFLFLQPVLC